MNIEYKWVTEVIETQHYTDATSGLELTADNPPD